jgi:ammonium transporter, Amt family
MLLHDLMSKFSAVKFLLRIDDALDLFAEHAIGGIIGLFCNGLFGSSTIIALDGVNTSINGGWIDHNWKQLYMQIAYIAAACTYTFTITALIAKCIDMIPGLHLRASEEAQGLGMDEDQVCIYLSSL